MNFIFSKEPENIYMESLIAYGKGKIITKMPIAVEFYK